LAAREPSGPADLGEDVTADALLDGRVRIFQPARGARMSLDPVLLAGFIAAPYGRFLDIGCGTGAVSFLLLARDPAATGVGVELQPRLAALAERGRNHNDWRARLDVVAGDVRNLVATLGPASFDLVVTNPPFRPVREGSLSPHRERALSNHELALSLPEWLDVAARAVRPGGRVAAIFPAERADELLRAMRARQLAPSRVRYAHPREGQSPLRVLVEAERGGMRAHVVEAPLVVHGDAGRFTDEVLQMLGQQDSVASGD
jgi:tRNA1Val (adenine37-N6)-methyltransferase